MAGRIVGTAAVSIFPTFKGLRRETVREATTAGRRFGERFTKMAGQNSEKSAGQMLAPFRQGIAKASAELSKARIRQQDMTERVAIAEKRLAEVLQRSGADSSQAMRATFQLEKARRSLHDADEQVALSSAKLRDRQLLLDEVMAKTSQSAEKSSRRFGRLGAAASNAGKQFAAGYRDMAHGNAATSGILASIGSITRALADLGRAVGSVIAKPFAPLVQKFSAALHVMAQQLARARDAVVDFGRRVGQTMASVASKIAAPFIKIGSKIAAPFIALGSKIATSMAALGSKIAASAAALGSKIAAPFIALGGKIRTALAPVGAAFAPLRDAVAGLGAKLWSVVPSGMRSAMSSMSSIASSGFKSVSAVFQSGLSGLTSAASAVGKTAAGAVAAAFAAITATVASHMGGAVSRVDTMNNYPKVMKNLGFSVEEATESVKALDLGIRGLPTSLDEIVSINQSIAPLESNLSRATDVTIAMNNALLAGGKGAAEASRAMRQYTQMLGKQDVDSMAWYTLMEVMPAQMHQLAKAMLDPTATGMDLYDAMKNGVVTFEDFNNKLLELNKTGANGFASFEQQAKDATTGIATAAKNTGTAITRNLGNALVAIGVDNITAMFNRISDSINAVGARVVDLITKFRGLEGGNLGKVFESIGTGITNLAPLLGFLAPLLGHIPLLGRLFTGLTGPIGAVIGLIVAMVANSEKLRGAFSGVFDKIMGEASAFEPILTKIIDVMGQITTVLGDALAPIITGVGDAIVALMPALSTLADSVLTTISETLTAISPTLTTFGEVIGTVLEVLGQMLAPIVELVAAAFPILGDIVGTILPPLGDLLQMLMPLLESIGSAFSTVFEALTPLLDPLRDIVNTYLPPGIDLFMRIIPPVIDLATAIVSRLTPVLEGLIKMLGGLLEFVAGVFTGDWGRAWDGIKQMFSGFVDAVVAIIDGTFRGVIKDIPSFISGVFSGAGSWLWDTGRSIIQGLIDGIYSAFDWVRSTLNELTGMLPEWKGPAEVDKVILKKSGQMVIRGFITGMEGQYPDAQKSLGRFTRSLAAHTDANRASGHGGFADSARPIVVNQTIQTATVPSDSQLASMAAARARVLGGVR